MQEHVVLELWVDSPPLGILARIRFLPVPAAWPGRISVMLVQRSLFSAMLTSDAE